MKRGEACRVLIPMDPPLQLLTIFAKAAILYISQSPKYAFITCGTEFCLTALYIVTTDSNVKINWVFGTFNLHNNYLGR